MNASVLVSLISLPQVNYYERNLELMRQSMELERRDISQTFKVTLLGKKLVNFEVQS